MSHDPQNVPNIHADSTARFTPALIVNADDWGRDVDTTDRSLDCVLKQTVSSVSAMLFMVDSERAAVLAARHGVDAGLHLNFTLPFSSPQCPFGLRQHQQRLSRFLTANNYAQVIYHPGLAASFDYVVKAQLEEYQRLYNAPPSRIDGHHHMHLCANVLFSKLIPSGTLVRRNFSFVRGEKSWINRLYRSWIDARLKKRHRLVDFLFSLAPIEPVDRLRRIADLARHAVVELETHPINPEEYRFLTSGEIFQQLNDLRIARGFAA